MKKILVVFSALCLTAGAFAQDWTWASKGADGIAVNPAKVKGAILDAGSSTVYPLAQLIGEQFKSEGYKDQISIDSIGSGAGLARFGKGEVDIANASREINDKEKAAVAALNKGSLQEYKVAMDAMVILANSKLSFLKNITKDQAKVLFGTAVNWSDVDPTWPKTKINRYIPETVHGTFDFAAEAWWNDKGVALKAAPNTQRFQDYNQLIDNIDKDSNGIGFIAYGYFKESEHSKAVSYEGVAPNKKTVADKSYKLSRYVFMYTTDKILQDKPQVAAFVAFVLNNGTRNAAKAGLFPLEKADLEAQKKQLADTLKGKF